MKQGLVEVLTSDSAHHKVSMTHRRIERCRDVTRAPMQPCKRQVRLLPGSPPPWPGLPEQAQSEKAQGVRGTESPDSFDNTLKKTENYVSVFSGEVQLAFFRRLADRTFKL